MKKLILLFSVFVFLLIGAGFAFADVLNFEDGVPGVFYPPPWTYNGFSIGAGVYGPKPALDDGTMYWDGTNGSYSIASYFFNPVTIGKTDGSEFSLDSLYVTTDAAHYTITIRGYRDNVQVAFTDQIDDSVHSQQYWINFASVHGTTEWDNIDSLWINSGSDGNSAHVCLDDITYNSGSAAVPEPATILLLGSGLFGLAGLRRRFKK